METLFMFYFIFIQLEITRALAFIYLRKFQLAKEFCYNLQTFEKSKARFLLF